MPAMGLDFLFDGHRVVDGGAAEHACQAVFVAEVHCLQCEFFDVDDFLRRSDAGVFAYAAPVCVGVFCGHACAN